MKRTTLGLLMVAGLARAGVVEDVREQIKHDDFRAAQAIIDRNMARAGATPELIEAVSWMGRGLLAKKDYPAADKYAQQAYALSTAALKKRPLDLEPHVPLALGAAIEVQANVLAATGARSEAIVYLSDELKKYYSTSIRTRIQKNINLLSLEGKPAPAIQGRPLALLAKDKPAIVFFWAHWCPDCKREAPILLRLKQEFGARGLVIVAPTQKYGYTAEAENVPPQVELPYIEQVRQKYYSGVVDAPARISEETFRSYGASTTPTLVLVDRKGIVRTYHPGAMTYEELRAGILAIL
jgi:thiol-disulfide isomerase/thioredoxin